MPTKQADLLTALKMMTLLPAAGAGVGGMIGAARAEKGKRLRTALGDAGVGALAGLGFGLGGSAGGAAGMALGGKTHPAVAEQNSASLSGLGAGLGAVSAGMLGQKLRKEMEEEYDASQNPFAAAAKIGSHKQAAGDDYYMPVGNTALIGAGVGGVLGGMSAPKGKTLKRMLGGAAIGGLGGAGMALGSNATKGIMNDLAPTEEPSLTRTLLPRLVGTGGALLGVGLGEKIHQDLEDADETRRPVVNIIHVPHKNKHHEHGKKENKTMKTEKQAGIEDALFENAYVPRATPGSLPTNSVIPENLLPWLLTGGGVGGLVGALRAEKGKRLKGALRGGAVGAGAGTLGAFGARAAAGIGDTEMAYQGVPRETLPPVGRAAIVGSPYIAGGLSAGLGGLMMDRAITHGEEKAKQYETESKKKDKPMKNEKKSAALSFGEKVAAGFDMSSIMNTGLGGAALGAGLGGLYGLLAPGEDGEGKRRGRLSGALRGALGGGLLGGGAAAVGEAASPGFGRGAYDYAHGLYNSMFGKKKPPVLEPLAGQTTEEYQKMLADNPFYQQTGRMTTPNAMSGNYLPQYGVHNGRIGPPMQ